MHFSHRLAVASAAFSVAHAAAGVSKRALSGEATFYGGNVAGGACSFSTYTLPSGIYGTALSDSNWDTSGECGACVSVTGPSGNSIVAMIVDECPGCGTNHLDLFPDAFAELADPSAGIIDVTWSYVDCPISSALSVHNKEGVSPYWFSMQVVNANQAVKSLEVSTDGGSTWAATTRKDYNFFENPSGFGTATVDVKVTSDSGDVVTINDVTVSPGVSQTASSNFDSSAAVPVDSKVVAQPSTVEPTVEPTTTPVTSSEPTVSESAISSTIVTSESAVETSPIVEPVVQVAAVEAVVSTPLVVSSALPTSTAVPYVSEAPVIFHEESASAASTPTPVIIAVAATSTFEPVYAAVPTSSPPEPVPAAASSSSIPEAASPVVSTSTVTYETTLPAVTIYAEASTSVVTSTVTLYTCTAETSRVTLSPASSTAVVTPSPSSTVASGMTYSNATTMAMYPSGSPVAFTGAGSKLQGPAAVFSVVVAGLVVLLA
ncbi:rare lipoprotein A [Phlyctema vagabunda]|uniref:Rare lipoprotein A n=1 Tax=Phlyctema vagabunda TaxID=108571 RepID=A0ABR4P9B9_9HELO